MDKGAWGATAHGVTKSDTTEQLQFLSFYFKIYLFYYLFLAALGLHCWCRLSLVAVHGLFIVVASLVAEHRF